MYKQIIITVFIISFSIFSNLACFARSFTYFESQDDKFKDFYNKGEEHIGNKKYNEAAKAFEEAYNINPKQMQAIDQLCSCYTELKHYDKLQELSKKGLLIAQNQLNNYYISRFYWYLGNSYKAKENYNEAIKNYQLAYVINNKNVECCLALHYCYFKLEKYEYAIKLLQLIKQLKPEYYEDNKLEKVSENAIKTAFEKDFILKHAQIASNYTKEKKYTDAINEFKLILSKNPEERNSLSQIINNEIIINSNNYNEIIDYSNKLIIVLDNKPKKDNYLYYEIAYKGLCYCYKMQNNSKLLSEYEKLSSCFNHIKKGFENISKNYTEDAINEYKLAIECISNLNEVPYNYSALDGIIDFYFEIQDYEGTKNYIQLGLNQAKKEKNKNKFVKYLTDIASYYFLSDKNQESLKSYQKVLEMAKDNKDKSNSYLGLAKTYLKMGNYQEAVNYFEKSKEFLNNDSLEISFDYETNIIKAKSMLDKDSDIYKALKHTEKGNNYFESGLFNEAIEEYAKSLEFRPQNLSVLQNLSLCLHYYNRDKEAYEVDLEGYNISIRDFDYSKIDIFTVELGKYYIKKQDENTALYYLNQYSSDSENYDYSKILTLKGMCHFILYELNEALADLEEAHSLDPDDKLTNEYLEKCRKMINEQ